MRKELKLTVILIIVSFASALGQSDFRDGFIITIENDTIHGFVDYSSNTKNYKSCLFKSTQGETVYFPEQINGFGYINDKFFLSQIVEGSFVEVLVFGEINLYKIRDKFLLGKGSEIYELESKKVEMRIDGKTGIKEDNKWRGIVTYLISDCLTNSSAIANSLELSEKSLTKLIIRYNNCKGVEFVEFKANRPWTKFDFGASIGLISSNILTNVESASYSYLDESYSSIDPSIGIMMAISSPRIMERVFFQTELYFVKSMYSSLIVLNELSTSYYYDTYIDLNTISVPLSLKYTFPEKKYSFYMQAGVNFDYHVNSDTKLLSEIVTGNVVNTLPQIQAFEMNSAQIGYWGGIGLIKSYDRFKGSLSIRYFQMPKLNKTAGFTANNSRLSINLIVTRK